ncbi:head GIN domain-containing protein [Flavobacterium oreochromis]|uniref:head GIN domain-containing protein n=1 Tax=Flavobacterium oreochromis TaxID=2906078 RepID=UPI0038591895
MIHLAKVIVTAIMALIFSSCNLNINGKTIKGNGKIIKKERALTGFSKISISQDLECEVTQGPIFKVSVEADENLHEEILTEIVDGNRLKISCKNGNYINIQSKKVHITLPIIEELEASSSSELRTRGVIKSNDIRLITNSAADLTATIESEKIAIDASSSSNIVISGKAIKLSIESSSSSDIDAHNLLANNIVVNSSSSSEIKIHPLISLYADASSNSSIYYYGSPKIKKLSQSSSGTIEKQ